MIEKLFWRISDGFLILLFVSRSKEILCKLIILPLDENMLLLIKIVRYFCEAFFFHCLHACEFLAWSFFNMLRKELIELSSKAIKQSTQVNVRLTSLNFYSNISLSALYAAKHLLCGVACMVNSIIYGVTSIQFSVISWESFVQWVKKKCSIKFLVHHHLLVKIFSNIFLAAAHLKLMMRIYSSIS